MSSTRQIRPPAVAGRFYEADPRKCAEWAQRLCQAAEAPQLPATLHGGIVPHAGWVCSGRIAGLGLATLARRTAARTIILTGSVHTAGLWNPALDTADAWRTPLGDVAVDVELRAALAQLPGFGSLDMAHEREHSLEVNVPLIQTAFAPRNEAASGDGARSDAEVPVPGAGVRIVPCLIPAVDEAAAWGRAIGGVLRDWPEPVVMVASSDLTHYGPNYGFVPHGVGPEGRRWAHEVNDARLLELVEGMEADRIVSEAGGRQNACGGGAIAATIACCHELGARRGHVLAHTDSTAELCAIGREDAAAGGNSVGYAAIVFG